jgi:TolB-like protein
VSLFEELKRRNVFRVAIAYLAAVWLLLQVADIVIPVLDGPEWLLKALFFSALLGFPLAVILAWFYELTPEGIKADTDVEVGEGVRFTGRKIDFLIIGLLVLVVGFLIIDDFGGPEGDRSIAVLPFDNRSVGDEDAAFFADGIHDDLITLLSKLNDIRVISRTSVERFKHTNQSIQEIANTLGVTKVLEGGVRVAGDRVRINVQLIEATTETGLWAEAYDRELTATNIFGIQSEVALNIVSRLQATLSHDERQRLIVVPTQNLEAYEAYLLGKREMTRRTISSLQTAVEQFQRATELDADFALAYVGLADTYSVLHDWGYLSLEKARPLIRAAATKALELDSQLGEAYVSLAGLYEVEGEYAAAEAAYTRAIGLSPGYATAHSWYGLFLRWRMGRIEEAVQHAAHAVALDPAHKMIADHYLYAYGRTNDALESYRYVVAIEENPPSVGDIGEVYLVLGDTAAAARWMEQAQLTDPDDLSVSKHLALLNYYRGKDDIAVDFALKGLEGPFYVHTSYMLFIVRNVDLRTGRHADARLRYEQFYPDLAEEDPVVHPSNYRAAIDLSVVLQRMGERQRSQLLLEKSLTAIRDMPRLGLFGYGSADAEIHALQGRSEEALSALRLAVEDGWWRYWYLWTELNPNLDSIRDEPEYGAIIARLESDMAIELARVQAGETQPSATVQ